VCVASCGRIGYDGGFDQVLTVDVLEDRMSAPDTIMTPEEVGGTLSLREALTISNNTPGTELVRFDPEIFAPGSPALIEALTPLPIGGAGTRIDCRGGVEVRGAPLVLDDISNVEVIGCRFAVSDDDAILVNNSSDVTIRNNVFLESGGHAIDVVGNPDECTGIRIEDNYIEHAGSALVAIYDCEDVYVADNFMVIGDKGAQSGVHFERVTQSRIFDNIIDPGSARLINFQDASNNEIRGNILDGADAGVVLYGVSADNLIVQNVVMEVRYDGVYLGGDALRNTVVHNTFFNCATALVDGGTDTTLGNNLESTEPTDFVNPTAPIYDFHLVGGSLHADAGEDMGYDCLPNSPERFLGTAPDLGAVETF